MDGGERKKWLRIYLIEVTSQLRATAALQILLPKNPLPPQTTSLFFAGVEAMLELLSSNLLLQLLARNE